MIIEEKRGVKIPEGRTVQLPTDLEHIWDGLDDIGVGPRWLAEVRKKDLLVEYGGPKSSYQSYCFITVEEDPAKVIDGVVTIIGPDIPDVTTPGQNFPAALDILVYGQRLTPEHQEYIERQVISSLNGIEGFMGFGAHENLWLRINKNVAHKLTLSKICQISYAILKTTMPYVEAVEFRWIVSTPELGGIEFIRPLREDRLEKWQAMRAQQVTEDEDVDVFYGCTVCKSLAPNHICVVIPSMVPYCGIMSYQGAKVAMELDPMGYTFEIPKGKLLDPVLGQYEGVNEVVHEKSNRVINTFSIYSGIKYPTTNCGCFEAASFYIPEVDGIGLVNRRYFGLTPLGIKFSSIAGVISGGSQNHGFKGLSVRSMESKRFMSGDGGWNRIVWAPEDLKAELADVIPEEVYDKIATEADTTDANELKEVLRQKKHPIVEKFWKDGEPQPLKLPASGQDWPD